MIGRSKGGEENRGQGNIVAEWEAPVAGGVDAHSLICDRVFYIYWSGMLCKIEVVERGLLRVEARGTVRWESRGSIWLLSCLCMWLEVYRDVLGAKGDLSADYKSAVRQAT